MNLEEFFSIHKEVAVAFSGGVDSSYLLYAAKKYAKKVSAYYVKSEFQPQFELDDAINLSNLLGVEMNIIQINVLEDDQIASNPENRCYYCKKKIFSHVLNQAKKDGFSVILDGTNASDSSDDRPGMKALCELKILSPLRMCGLTKDEIRSLSEDAKLFTWNKPAYACLATRIKTGEKITKQKLKTTEISESFMYDMGFRDFRIRTAENEATIQIKEQQKKLFDKYENDIFCELEKHYHTIKLDKKYR